MNESPYLVPARCEGRALRAWPLARRFCTPVLPSARGRTGLAGTRMVGCPVRFCDGGVGWPAGDPLVDRLDLAPAPPTIVGCPRNGANRLCWAFPAPSTWRFARKCKSKSRPTSKNEVPAPLREEPAIGNIVVASRSAARVAYQIRPRERGEVRMGRVFVRYRTINLPSAGQSPI